MGCRNPCSKNLIPAIVAWSLLVVLTSVYLIFVCWEFSQTYNYGIIAAHGLLIIFVVVNFTRSTFMDPGAYPVGFPDERPSSPDSRPPPLYKNIDVRGVSIRMKWCTTCEFYRPPRCSHCSVCKHCIDTFDHHCPWVNNCIGRRNYRYFFIFLLSLTIHMACVFSVTLVFVLHRRNSLAEYRTIIAIILLVLVGLLKVPIIGLTGFHIFLVVNGRTTNEQVTSKFGLGMNPFTYGCWQNCCFVLCGPQMPRLKVRRRKVPVDATLSYRANDEKVNMYVQGERAIQNRNNYNRMYAAKPQPTAIPVTLPEDTLQVKGSSLGRGFVPPGQASLQAAVGNQYNQNNAFPQGGVYGPVGGTGYYDGAPYYGQQQQMQGQWYNSAGRQRASPAMERMVMGRRPPPVAMVEDGPRQHQTDRYATVGQHYQPPGMQHLRQYQHPQQNYSHLPTSPRLRTGGVSSVQPLSVHTVVGSDNETSRSYSERLRPAMAPADNVQAPLRPISFVQAINMGQYFDRNSHQAPPVRHAYQNQQNQRKMPYQTVQPQQPTRQSSTMMTNSGLPVAASGLNHYQAQLPPQQQGRRLDEQQLEVSPGGTFEISV